MSFFKLSSWLEWCDKSCSSSQKRKWSARGDAIKILSKGCNSFQKTLWTTERNVYEGKHGYGGFWVTILDRKSTVSKSLQSETIELRSAVCLLNSLLGFLNSLFGFLCEFPSKSEAQIKEEALRFTKSYPCDIEVWRWNGSYAHEVIEFINQWKKKTDSSIPILGNNFWAKLQSTFPNVMTNMKIITKDFFPK